MIAAPLPGEEKEATEQGKSLKSDSVQYTIMPWGGRGTGKYQGTQGGNHAAQEVYTHTHPES